jgi:hypothetical protein
MSGRNDSSVSLSAQRQLGGGTDDRGLTNQDGFDPLAPPTATTYQERMSNLYVRKNYTVVYPKWQTLKPPSVLRVFDLEGHSMLFSTSEIKLHNLVTLCRKEHSVSRAVLKTWHFLFGSFLGKLLGIILGSVLLFASYLFISRTIVYNSDNASIIFEAQSILNGNYILHGWYVPTDNFLTIEIPLYALGLLLGFSQTSLLHIIPALLYTLVVISGGYLTSMLLQGKQRLWGLLAFLGIVAFPPLDMVQGIDRGQGLLTGPIHIGTILFIIVGLIAYRYRLCSTEKRHRRVASVGVLLMIVLNLVGDPFALVLFVLPLLLTESLQMYAKKQITLRQNFMLLGILPATVLAFGIREILEIAGQHNVLLAGFLLTSLPGMVSNFITALKCLSIIFHANIFTKQSASFFDVALFINLFLLIALSYTIIRWSIHSLLHLTIPSTKVTSTLLCGSIGVFSAFVLSTLGGMSGIRYLYPLLFFIGIVSFFIMYSFINKYVLKFTIILVLLANGTAFAVSFYQTPPVHAPEEPLITLLKEHHLTQGLGSYWVSSIVTVQTEEQIVMRQVIVRKNRIHPYYFLADGKWFNDVNLQNANFLVYMEKDDSQAFYEAALQTFGKPKHQYKTGVYTVLTWNTPLITLLPRGYSFATP